MNKCFFTYYTPLGQFLETLNVVTFKIIFTNYSCFAELGVRETLHTTIPEVIYILLIKNGIIADVEVGVGVGLGIAVAE